MSIKRPDVVFSKGGFSALPPILAAAILRIPIIAHESDATPGIANRITKRFAKILLTSFPTNGGMYVGTPLRSEIEKANAAQGRKFLNFSRSSRPLIFGFGGSQGGKLMNNICAQSLEKILKRANVVWIAGPKNLSDFSNKKNKGFRLFPYIHEDFFNVLAAADIVVSRAGSSSIFETAAMKKPMLLIPLSTAAGNHQEKNAEVFRKKGAAEVILEKDLTPELFQKKLIEILESEEKSKSLSNAAEKIGKTNAAEKIADILLKK